MIEEMIDNIISAEDKAQEIIKDSVNKSNDIVNAAQKQAKEMIEKAKDDEYELEQKAVAKGESEGAKRHKANLAKAQKQVDAMPELLQNKKQEIVDCIIQGLKSKYDK